MTDGKLAQLVWYGTAGFPIFPVTPRAKAPPLVAHWKEDASTSVHQIAAWHAKYPDANWAMRTGRRCNGGSGVIVVDIDGEAGLETWELLRDENPDSIETVEGMTGGGGRHLWFAQPDDFEAGNTAGALGPHVDTRADGGYILIPPSITALPYAFRLAPDCMPPADLPAWIRKRLSGKPTGPVSERLPEQIPEGERHSWLVATGGAMRRIGLSEGEIRAGLEAISQRFSTRTHPITPEEIAEIAAWVASKPRAYMLTDLGNAERFEAQHAGKARWVPAWESWIVWDGRRWKRDDLAAAERLAYLTTRGIYNEAQAEADGEKRKKIALHAIRTEARGRIVAMLEMTKPFLSIEANALDVPLLLVNLRNGTLDLHTGELHPHDPADMLTRLIDVDHVRDAEAPHWQAFLELVTGGNKQLQLFLQMAVGYSLTGLTDEHCLFILHGMGANGKTTFMEALRQVFGDYATRTDVEALLTSWHDGTAATPYIARMQGARLVIASEVPEGRKLAEATIKDLTGGDTLIARQLFRSPIEFRPTHKLWIFGNHRPQITGADYGIWRRVQCVPFAVTIPTAMRRPMSQVLAEFRQESAGILAWAVEGCLLWQSNSLPPTDAIKEATEQYRGEMDVVRQFLDERCEFHPDYSILTGDLYRNWREWCEANGERDALKRAQSWFTRRLREHDCERGGDGRAWMQGVRLVVPG